jgi:hypothetical protein
VRTDKWDVAAKISMDKNAWNAAVIPNISADGLLFYTDRYCEEGDVLWLELNIDPKLPNIEKFKLAAHCKVVAERDSKDGLNAYSAVFYGLSAANYIRLDELVEQTVLTYSPSSAK